MRIAGLQPSTTLILAGLNRLDHLVTHTRYCREALPDLTVPGITPPDAWSTTAQDTAALTALRPDLILTSIPYRLESLAAMLKAGLPIPSPPTPSPTSPTTSASSVPWSTPTPPPSSPDRR